MDRTDARAASRNSPTTQASRSAYAARARRQQGGARQSHQRPAFDQGGPARAFRRPHQAHPRIQAPASERLDTIALYNEIRAHPTRDFVPRVKIFAGKAAASYHLAKLIIKLVHDVGRVVNNDPAVRGMLKVVFLPNYNVSLAEAIIPASDLSEQISTAGMEASGTGNMKFALNGALTIGTLDGANVEIREHVGDDNIFIFGLTAAEVNERRSKGIDARETIAASPRLREALDEIATGVFSPDDTSRYAQLVDILTYHDHFMVTADFESYCGAQQAVARWRDSKAWWRRAY